MARVQNSNTNGPCPQWAYNTSTNRLTTSGFTYDAAGNLTTDASTMPNHTYQWDAEGRVSSVDSGSTWTFTYDALGDRVQMTVPSGSQYLAYDVAGNWIMVFGVYGNYDVVRWGERMFSIYTSTGTEFNHVNNLSSTSIYTNQAGTAVEDMLFYPWGQVWESWGTGGYNFADLPYRDLSTTTDLTAFRVFSPNIGRWHSPDPVGADISNPQSLDRYPYVLNNPTSLTDPLGLQGCPPGTHSIGRGQCVGPVKRLNSFLEWDLFDLLTRTACLGQGEGCETWAWLNGMYVANLLATGPGGLSGAYGKALGTLGKVFRGRPPGQSFGACVGQNMSLTFTGSTNSPISTTVTSGIIGIGGVALGGPTFGGAELAARLAIAAKVLTSALPGDEAAAEALISGAVAAGQAAPPIALGVGAIGLAPLIGSAANCASVGVAP